MLGNQSLLIGFGFRVPRFGFVQGYCIFHPTRNQPETRNQKPETHSDQRSECESCLGWVVEYLKRNPVLPIEKLKEAGFAAIPPGVTLRMFPSIENPLEIWRAITDQPYQISASYVLRVGY